MRSRPSFTRHRERSDAIQSRCAAHVLLRCSASHIERQTIVTTIFFFFAMPAQAHTGVGATHGFVFGFAHPFDGLDHLAAMLAVGWLAARIRGRWRFSGPLAFLAFMTFGATLGELDVPPNLLQALTFNSAIMLGVMLTTRLGANRLLALFLVGGFGLFHGLAHGSDAPQGAEGLAFLCGLVAATAFGHALGLVAALAISRFRRSLVAMRMLRR